MAGWRAVTDDLVQRLRRAGCVYAEDEARLLRAAATTEAELAALAGRRVAGEPLEQLLGWVELDGHRYAVGPGVFVPRQRSRLLITTAVALLPDGAAEPVVVEICCGVAAVGAAIARRRPDAEVWAADVDPVAVEIARRNLPPQRVVLADLFDGLPPALRGSIDVLVANAPYVPTGELAMMPVEAREHEPVRALDGGTGGVEIHRRIAAGVTPWLAPGGAVVVETSRRQAASTAAAFEAQGLVTTEWRDDEVEATAVVASVPG